MNEKGNQSKKMGGKVRLPPKVKVTTAECRAIAAKQATACTPTASGRTGRRNGKRCASHKIAGVMSAHAYHPVTWRTIARPRGIDAPRIRSQTYVDENSASAATDHTARIVSMDTRRVRIVPER